MRINPKAVTFYGVTLFCVASWIGIVWVIKQLLEWLTS